MVAAFGVLGFVMERNGYPVAALVLGIVMGSMVEQSFVTSLIKSDGDVLPFFERPVSSRAGDADGGRAALAAGRLDLAARAAARRRQDGRQAEGCLLRPRQPFKGGTRP
jgi:hypothetical protein